MIAAKGEYAGWRATRATGDFDLRTFAIRAYPVDKIDGLRPGMSVYTDGQGERSETPAPPRPSCWLRLREVRFFPARSRRLFAGYRQFR